MEGDCYFKLCHVPGKGLGVVATKDLSPGTLVILEKPLLVLDPPTDRKQLLKTLGCDWCKVDMRAPPELVRSQIQRMILEKTVKRMREEERDQFMALTDKTAKVDHEKTPWGVFLTNCLPMGSYRVLGIYPTMARINHSCKPNAHHFFNEEDGTEEVVVMEPIKAGEEITISYIRTFCSRNFRQELLQDKFGFRCTCCVCLLTGEKLCEDDRLRHEIDKLAQDFGVAKQCTKEEDLIHAISIGEQMVSLMHQLGFSPSVTWPGYFSLFELEMQVGNMKKAQVYADISYKMVCLAKGYKSKDAMKILMCLNNANNNMNNHNRLIN